WLPRLVQSSGGKATIITASTGIAPLRLGSAADPHAWQSVNNAKIYVANIGAALAAADPSAAEQFRKNTQAYLEKLDALDREVREAVAKLPSN
ncbi:zinc ABC transporter substrate-binding protein, partial [Acinetobacter baumannii]